MRSPDASLIRARAKAPLPDLLVLHLTSADIESVKHLELCKSLQSLYADSNNIKDLEGVVELSNLWRLDLSGNLLENLHALASFRALGFLYLERNRISFEDLVCLRDQHLLEIRLLGNTGLLKGNTINNYRRKVVALLPNAWILDGHFISTAERQQAIEDFDPFVVELLKHRSSAAGDSKFGSATDTWVESKLVTEDTAELNRTVSLMEIAHRPPYPSEPPDLRRLQTIVAFHNAESALHNAHCHFAPSRHSPNARLMPTIWLDEVLALPRRTRLEVITLLSVFLEFHFPKVLLSEALTIRQLDSPRFPSEAIRDLAYLPAYALVALIAISRHSSIAEEQALRSALKPEVSTPEFEEDSEILGAIPVLFTTLTSTKRSSTTPGGDSDLQATTIRCRRAIKLLSNVASFPDPETVAAKGKGKREAIFRELLPLIRAADPGPLSPATQDGRKVVVPYAAISSHKTVAQSPTGSGSNTTSKRSMMVLSCEKPSDATAVTPSSPEREPEARQYIASLDRVGATGSAARRKPKPGDWVGVCLKQFVRIQFLSADGLFVVGALPTDSSRTITISLEQMARISSCVWRVNHLTKQQTDELSATTTHSKPDGSSSNNTLIGKLHRDSDGFHRHGAARNQGFPNHFVTSQMLQHLDRERSSSPPLSGRTKAVEVFSSNDTLDANYVLASPEHISAQNCCAVSSFLQQRRAPRGLWSPLKQPPPCSVLSSGSPVASLGKLSSLKDLKMRKLRVQKQVAAPAPQQADDWLEIRRAMQAQLGIEEPSDSSVASSLVAAVLDDRDGSAPASQAVRQESSNCGQRGLLRAPPPSKLAAARAWHQVATKTEFIVAAALEVSHSVPLLRPAATKQPSTLKLVLPSISKIYKP